MSKPPDVNAPNTAQPGGAKLLELLWLDPKRTSRARRRPAWRAILDEARNAAPDEDDGDPVLPNQDVSPEDRRDFLLILARGEATDANGVQLAVSESVREDGKYAPALVLVAGELRFGFDEMELLKATVATATPFAAGDEALKSSIDAAREFLALPDVSPAPAVVELIAGRIRDAFGRVKRAVPPTYLETQTERVLLEQRRYQVRTSAGAPHLRASIQTFAEKSDRGAMLVYLPETLADKLPLQQRFAVRFIAEAHLSMDQLETQPFALEAIAIAREVAVPRLR